LAGEWLFLLPIASCLLPSAYFLFKDSEIAKYVSQRHHSRSLPPYRLLVLYLNPRRKAQHEGGKAVRNGQHTLSQFLSIK
jgi:hypothetical protein